MTFPTNVSKNTKDSYKILDFPNYDVLQRQQSRRKTDTFFLFVFAASIAILLPFLIYTLCHSDINRLEGYDKCGNICGQKNAKYDHWDCTGQDMTLKPFLSYERKCIENTNYYFYPRSSRQNIFDSLRRGIWKIALVSFVPLALCLILVVLFRYHPAVAVWGILVGSWVIFTAGGMLFFYATSMWYGIPITIYCIISVLIYAYILVNLTYIRLSTALLKEAARAFFEVKMMFFVPSAALCGLVAILLVHAIVNFQLTTYGKLTEIHPGTLDYVSDNLMPTTMILSFVTAFWAILFILGAQYTTVSGAVAQWHTSNNQDDLNFSVRSNLLTTVKYHLGTVALGSVMMTVMFIPRLILQFFAIFSALKRKADSGLRYLDGFFTNNSYIITAIYGTPFVQSGKKAANLLNLSVGETRDLNSFANSVIHIAQIIIVFISTFAAFMALLDNYTYGFFFLCMEIAIACVCVHTILGTLKISTNTLFLCATDELLKDKDSDLPFTMTMKEALNGFNKLLLQKVQSRPSSNIPQRSSCIIMCLFIFVAMSCLLSFAYYI